MPTVHHPAFPEVTAEVAGDHLDEHLAQGWVLLPDPIEDRPFLTGEELTALVGPSVQHIPPFDPTEQDSESNEPFNNGGSLPDGQAETINDTSEPEHVAYSFRRRNR